jgi:hypothetical protein
MFMGKRAELRRGGRAPQKFNCIVATDLLISVRKIFASKTVRAADMKVTTGFEKRLARGTG